MNSLRQFGMTILMGWAVVGVGTSCSRVQPGEELGELGSGARAMADPADPPSRPPDGKTTITNRWALLIGVDDYAEAQKLEYCGADMRALREQLVTSGFPDKQVFLLHDKASESKYRPMKANIERQLNLVLDLIEPDDLLIVGFSGHGVHMDGKSYLCPVEAQLDDAKTLVSLDEVYHRLEKCRAAMKVFLVDACRNDPRPGGQRSMAATEGTKQFAASLERSPRGILLLTSCAPGQVSWEEKEFGHGVFMHFVLEGLRGRADADGSGRVSLVSLYRYVNRETKTYVARKFNRPQTPALRGDIPDDFELSMAAPQEITNSIGMKLVRISAGEFMMGSKDVSAEIARAKFNLDAIPKPQLEPLPMEPSADAKTNSVDLQVGRERIEKENKRKQDEYDEKVKVASNLINVLNSPLDDCPAHRVRITKPFYMGIYEVKVEQFRRFVTDANYKTEAEQDGNGGIGYDGKSFTQKPEYTWRNAGFVQTDDHPVVNVSWNDAVAFCEWLSRKEGKTYRLPTEAQWEYACRAGTTTPFSFGSVLNGKKANCNGNYPYGTEEKGSYLQRTTTVGSYSPNPFGLYDMHGNVWEWCADWHDNNYYAASPTDDPTGPTSGSFRVFRGGGWDGAAKDCRSANRLNTCAPTGIRNNLNVGFRVSLVLAE